MAAVMTPVRLTSDRGPGARAELITEYKKRLIRRQRDRSVFLTMLMGKVFGDELPTSIPAIRHEAADNGYQFKWFETTRLSPKVTLTAGATAAGTTLTCADCSMVTPCENLRVISNPGGAVGEIMRVDSGATITSTQIGSVAGYLDRGRYGTTAAALYTGAVLLRIGTAIPEHGVTELGQRAGTRTEHFGACQEYRLELGMSLRRRCSQSWYGWDWAEDEKDRVADHFELIERSLIFNEAAQVTDNADTGSGGSLTITTAGLEGRISTHRFDAGGSCTYDEFISYLGAMQRANAGNNCRWVILAGQRVLQHLSLWGIQYYQSKLGDTAFGLRYTAVDVPNVGRVPFYWAPVLDESHMSDGCYIIDTSPDYLALRYLQEGPSEGEDSGRSWDIATSMGESGDWIDMTAIGSSEKKVYLRNCVGLELNDEARCGIITKFATGTI